MTCLFMCGCQSDFEENNRISDQESNGVKYDITTEPLSQSLTTRGFSDENYQEGYRCSSNASSLVADIYVSDKKDGAATLILNKEGEPAFYLKTKIENVDDDGTVTFTALNEFDEPILSGTYNEANCYYEITKVYGNDVVTRASGRAWGCNLALWGCGTIWGCAFGGPAGIAISLAYTCAAVAMCDM